MNQTTEHIFAEISKLAPDITSRAAEIETARRIPLDLVETLRSIGIFRLFVPRSHGGLELDLPTGLEVIRALSRIDGSVGWTAMIGGGNGLVPALLPRDIYEEIYRNGPDIIIAGSAQPGGTAEVDADGWGGNGRWGFSGGFPRARRIFGLWVRLTAVGPRSGAT